MWRTGLVAPWHVGSSWTRARTRVPCIGRQILNHCATREVPYMCFYALSFMYIDFFKKFILFIYLFIYLAVLGLHFCARAFSSCSEQGPLFIAVHRPLTVAASLVGEHRLQMRRLSSCGSRAQLLRGMWDPPRPGLEPVSPALAGRFSTTAPPGKPCILIFIHRVLISFRLFIYLGLQSDRWYLPSAAHNIWLSLSEKL